MWLNEAAKLWWLTYHLRLYKEKEFWTCGEGGRGKLWEGEQEMCKSELFSKTGKSELFSKACYADSSLCPPIHKSC